MTMTTRGFGRWWAMALLALSAGCEKDLPAGASFRIEPERVALYGRTAEVLTAVGGEAPLAWRVTDTNLGAVSGSGATVTYTRGNGEGANIVEVTDTRGWIAAATILQAATLILNPPGPVSVTGNGEVVVFAVSGGLAPYRWSVIQTDRGRIEASDNGAQAAYVRLAPGQNTVLVTDREGETVSATVSQPGAPVPEPLPPPVTEPLAISPVSATVAANGDSQSFVASGGVPPYVWAVNNITRGTIVMTGTASALYTRDGAGQNIVILRDQSGAAVFATVTQP